jgi:hypothetical protein
MGDPAFLDLAAVDRDVATTVGRWRAWRQALRSEVDAAADADPFEEHRYVAGQSALVALAGLDVAERYLPLRDALARWAYTLTQARIARDLDVAWARAVTTKRARYAGEPPALVSVREAWRGVVQSRSVGEAQGWLEAVASVGPELAPIAREWADRELEVSRRLSRDAPPDPAGLARALLDRTHELFVAVCRELGRDEASPLTTILAAAARGASDGWPRRLTTHWLGDVFGEVARGLAPRIARPLPSVVGAASFARALHAFGVAAHAAAVPRGIPFALAHEPEPIRAHRFGYAFAALPARDTFHRVALRVSRRVASAQARALARSALFEARAQAARVLLSSAPARRDASLFEEITSLAFGAPLPRSLAGAWPAPRVDEAARLLGLASSERLSREMIERLDVDWFQNPRSVAELRRRASLPEPPGSVETEESVTSIARALEEALG